jgi:hypothetical protein
MVGLPVIPALRRLRQEDCKFEASLGYIERPSLEPSPQKINVLAAGDVA